MGEDRSWGTVFVVLRPADMRGPTAVRLLRRTQLLVIHDSNIDDASWPSDWRHSRSGDQPVFRGSRAWVMKNAKVWSTIVQVAF